MVRRRRVGWFERLATRIIDTAVAVLLLFLALWAVVWIITTNPPHQPLQLW